MILDTNAISALADGDNRLEKLLQDEVNHHIPVIVLGEYRYGIRRSRERLERDRWLDKLEEISTVLPVTAITARIYAQLRDNLRIAGTPIPENDIWIAASAKEHQLAVVSNDQHFDYVSGVVRKGW